MYTRASKFVSNTCHPWLVSCMQEHDTYVAHKTCQTQAPRLLILTSLQNPRPILSKSWHSSVGLIKPKANTSLVQDSTYPRFTLGEALSSTKFHPHGNSRYKRSTLDNISYLLSVQEYRLIKKPKVCSWYSHLQNSRSTLGTKTQGPPLVHTSTKPKAPPWSTHMQQLWRLPPSSTKRTITPSFGKTFNQVEAHVYFSQPSEEYFYRSRQPTTRFHNKTFNQVQLTLTPHNHQRRNSAGQATYPYTG